MEIQLYFYASYLRTTEYLGQLMIIIYTCIKIINLIYNTRSKNNYKFSNNTNNTT